MSQTYYTEVWMNEDMTFDIVKLGGEPSKGYARHTPSTNVLNADIEVTVFWPQYDTRDDGRPERFIHVALVIEIHDVIMEYFEGKDGALQ